MIGFPPWGSLRDFGPACGTEYLWYPARHDCWYLCLLLHTNPLAGALTNTAGIKHFPWHQSWRSTKSSGLGRGSAVSGGHLEEGKERGFITLLQPHTSLPLQHNSWAAPAVPSPAVLSATFVSQQEKAWQQIPRHHDRREWRVFQHLETGRIQD